LHGLGSAEDLAGHHPGDAHQPDRAHGIQDGGHSGSDGLAGDVPGRLTPGGAQSEQRLDGVAVLLEGGQSLIQPKAYAG